MKKKIVRNFETEVMDLLCDTFNIVGWTIEFEESEKKAKENYHSPNFETAAEIVITPNYKRFTITVYPLYKTYSKEKKFQTLVHEFCHLVTHPIAEIVDKILYDEKFVTMREFRNAKEAATSEMESIIMRLLGKGTSKTSRFYQKL